ncbi:MAG: exonuclease SbcCD subunit D C-terminal domain-containing protein [Candidatus Sedimenticola sp. (ex Thyasira tokunagai)]
MLRIIHTADWHLGHTLHGVSRHYEHEKFLDWLLERMEERQIDALIVAGDIFDSANPPTAALSLFYRFLVEAKRRLPSIDLVLTGGNHDSPSRLEAPSPILDALGVTVIGGIGQNGSAAPDYQRLLIPLTNRDGETEAWCLAMPFLRNADLPNLEDETLDPFIEGVRSRYDDLLALALERRGESQGLVVTGHCYMVGGELSEMSERRILGGNQHALPVNIFGEAVVYAALGHLHLAQRVGGHEHIRYSGSPIPLSLSEVNYAHQVVELEMVAGKVSRIEPLKIPRKVDILRIPQGGAVPLDQVVTALGELKLDHGMSHHSYPFLEVRVLLERPEPALRRQIEEAITDLPLRLLKVTIEYSGSGGSLADKQSETRLEELQPEQVFLQCYRRSHDEPPPQLLLDCFHQLLESVQTEEG